MTNSDIENKIDEILYRLKNQTQPHKPSPYHKEYHKKCTEYAVISGIWLEFGVYRGRTICEIAENTKNIVYGFDSFEGLPEYWDERNPACAYNLAGKVPEGAIAGSNQENPGMFDASPSIVTKPWPANVKLVKGLFQDTLEEFLKQHSDNVSFLHIDSDIYSSAAYVLEKLETLIVPGTVIAFDEICDYPNFRKHEIKAFAEFLLRTNLGYKPVERLYDHEGYEYSQGCFIIEAK